MASEEGAFVCLLLVVFQIMRSILCLMPAGAACAAPNDAVAAVENRWQVPLLLLLLHGGGGGGGSAASAASVLSFSVLLNAVWCK